MATLSPALLKWWLPLELTRLREAAGITRQQVAEHLDSSLATVRNAESGRNFPRPLELRAMLDLYGVPERAEQVAALVRSAKRGRDWFEEFSGVAPPWFDLFLGFESSATQIESYDSLVVPGLFQTREYAERIIRGGDPTVLDEEVERRVALRMTRQDVLTRTPDPPTVWRVLDESVLYRGDDPEVLRAQLLHLAALAELPTVTIQVLPMRNAPHVGLHGTFTCMELPLLDNPAIAYTDGMIQGTYYESPEAVREYRNALTHLQIAAVKPAQSVAIIMQRAQELGS